MNKNNGKLSLASIMYIDNFNAYMYYPSLTLAKNHQGHIFLA